MHVPGIVALWDSFNFQVLLLGNGSCCFGPPLGDACVWIGCLLGWLQLPGAVCWGLRPLLWGGMSDLATISLSPLAYACVWTGWLLGWVSFQVLHVG
eukprot:6677684-Karenia_brevis.AAC.1